MLSGGPATAAARTPLPAAPTLDELRDALARLAGHDGAGLSEAELIDQLTAMEQLKNALAAAQARVTVTLAATRADAEAAAGIPADRRARGLGAEIGLARQESPHRGARHLGLAQVLVGEMPHTLAALTRGEITEWTATLIARETATLTRAHRANVDRELASRLTGTGDRSIAAQARAIGYRLDPGAALRRIRGAEGDRRVGIRPAPDTMTFLTGLLPVAQGVACHTALRKEADAKRAAGDPRTRGQIMADTLVQRITGQTTAESTGVEIGLIITDTTLLGDDHTPAHLDGHGPIPGWLGRRLVRDADTAWVRRLYTHPDTGDLIAMDSRRRHFDGQTRRFLIGRDQTCRTPWCDAPIRHADHITRAADGGQTCVENGQGLCETCNYTKEHPGWTTRLLPDHRHTVQTTTPTAHTHRSRAPDPPGPRRYRLDIVIPARAA